MVLVDSSVWIEAGRRNGDLACKVGVEGLLEEYAATLCSPVRMEVLGTARPEERTHLDEYFSILPYRSVDERTWQTATRNNWKLRDAGFTLPWTDTLIATLSILMGCRVYAKDQHFLTMRDVLGIRLYEPGYGGKYQPDVE